MYVLKFTAAELEMLSTSVNSGSIRFQARAEDQTIEPEFRKVNQEWAYQSGNLWLRIYEAQRAGPNPETAPEELAAAYERIAQLETLLAEIDDYLDDRADADCDQDGFIPNAEMNLLSRVREVA